MTGSDRSGLRVLEPDACWRHLTSHRPRVCRLAFRQEGRLHLIPAAYALDNRSIVLCTDPARLLGRLPPGEPISFEVDAVDDRWEQGWSVLVQGTLAVIDDAEGLRHARQLPLHPWAPGADAKYLRIDPERISGRRIV